MLRSHLCRLAFLITPLLFALFTLSATPGRAGQLFSPPTIHPKTYTSPSGEYALMVDPNDRYGSGGASYRLTRKGQQVWAGKQPFTLLEAGVTDTGIVGGYAYQDPERGVNRDPKHPWGDFRVAIIDASGKLRLDHATPRKGSRYPDGSPTPIAHGMFIDGPNDRLVVRVSDPDINQKIETWLVYRISSGETLSNFAQKTLITGAEARRSILDARPVAGTPLSLLNWWQYTWQGIGARFSLIDLQGNTVWSLDIPKDYSLPARGDAEDRLQNEIRQNGAILQTDQPGHFDVRLVAANQRVTFAVNSQPGGTWQVAETERINYVPASVLPVTPKVLPTQSLTYLGSITLAGGVGASPVRDVSAFACAGNDRIAFVRHEERGAYTFLVVDGAGKAVKQIPLNMLSAPAEGTTSHLLWMGGTQFLLTHSVWGLHTGNKAMAWRLDSATGRITPLEGFDCPSIRSLAALPNGGFVALTYGETVVMAFDAQGKQLWNLKEIGDDNPASLLGPEALAVTTEGKVVVLSTVPHTLKIYDSRGKYLKTVDLDKAAKHELSYPSGLAADNASGVFVRDFMGHPSVLHIDVNGKLEKAFQPAFPGGKPLDLGHNFQVAPDGHLWMTNRYNLLRLNGAGKVDKTLGELPNPDHLGAVASLQIDRKGQIYALDERTYAVHVFDSAGRLLHVCRPSPNDSLEEHFLTPDVEVATAGDVYLWGANAGKDEIGYLHFSPQGKRLGVEVGQAPSPQGKGVRWTKKMHQIGLLDAKSKVVRALERHANGNWFEYVSTIAEAPDGSLAALDTPFFARGQRKSILSLYSAAGIPQKTLDLSSVFEEAIYRFAYDGKRILASDGKRVVALQSNGEPLWQFVPHPQGAKEDSWEPFLTYGGRELRLFDGLHTLYRYALP